ncbi:DUF3316 domain-containing protein [Vibrio sp.]|uniref:DUF3316 domain-containing protein n=1 Tax=Vibrio sp. TaxID=678 RepID=UPI003D0E3724
MLKVMSIASVLLFSAMATAGLSGNYSTLVNTSSMSGQAMESREAALQAGRQMIMDINAKSAYDLSRAVNYPTNDQVDRNSFELLDSHVTIQEIVTSEGNIAYQPVVNVSYEYKARRRN